MSHNGLRSLAETVVFATAKHPLNVASPRRMPCVTGASGSDVRCVLGRRPLPGHNATVQAGCSTARFTKEQR